MNSTYSYFREKYTSALLEGQSLVMRKLQKNFFPELEKKEPPYFPTLVRMPTGTGKTGVIGITAYFGNHQGSTLILTPWTNLCDQMKEDLEGRFWDNIRLSVEDKEKFIIQTNRLLPSKLGGLLDKAKEERLILIGTLSGLQNLEHKYEDVYNILRSRISLVIVDEGHYEPAVLWGRAVKNLNRPTLIVTATPYRNDLKLFRVPNTQVFHYKHEAALKATKFPLRDVKPIRLKAKSNDFESVVKEFAQMWKQSLRKNLPSKQPRAIICCESKMRIMQALRIVYDAGISVLAFHERVEKEDFDDLPVLKDFFIQKVPRAKDTSEEIWIHQHKLTEEVDDSRFSAILLTYPIANDRKLIQQVGRVLRHSNSKPSSLKGPQTAIVAHCADYNFEEVWSNYLSYEKKINLVTGEHYRKVISDYLDLQPDYEYFDKRFRKRLAPFTAAPNMGGKTKNDKKRDTRKLNEIQEQWRVEAQNTILTPPSVLIMFIKNDFDINEFVGATTDGLLLRDAVILNVLGNDEPIVYEKNGAVFWLYASIKNSDILLSRSAYEISIEARFIHRIRKYLFIGDTSGITSEDYLSKFAQSCDYFDLAKCLSNEYIVRQASLFNTQSLNTAIRRTIRQGIDLDFAPYQISEKKYVCQNLRAKRKGIVGERYFGLTTSRISDRVSRNDRRSFNLIEFKKWAETLADLLDVAQGSSHSFFSRYANISKSPSTADPFALILDPNPDPAELQQNDGNQAQYDELDISWQILSTQRLVDLDETVFMIEANSDEEWPYLLKIEIKETNHQNPMITEVLLQYDPLKGRFYFKKGDRTEFQIQYKNDVFTIAHILNTRQDRFAITLKEPNLVYHNRQFFELDYSQAEAKFSNFIEQIPALQHVDIEKIPKNMTKTKKRKLKSWPSNSVFAKTLSDVIPHANFGKVEWLFCDDPLREIADFIAVNFSQRKIAFVHCKFGRGSKLSASAFHDLCSQAAKNLVYLRTSRLPPNIDLWKQNALWEGTLINKWIKGSKKLPETNYMWRKIRTDILEHPAGQIEVWLVMGNGLAVNELNKVMASKKETPEVGPLLHLLDGLVANCAEAAVKLRIFGH